jgi:hypothetical protein
MGKREIKRTPYFISRFHSRFHSRFRLRSLSLPRPNTKSCLLPNLLPNLFSSLLPNLLPNSIFCLLFCLLFLSTGCSTYSTKTQHAQDLFYAGDYTKAYEVLEKPAQEEGKDQLLYLLDSGMALQLSDQLKASEKMFLAADRMSEVKDYVSLSTEAATLITNDGIRQYKGEDFEKVLINAFLAIDYAVGQQYEDALVECRRVNQKLYLYKTEAKRNYEQNPFARYLSALIWEATGHDEDAYIDFKETFKLAPDFPYLKQDLLTLARKLDRPEDLKIWRKEFGEVAEPKKSKKESQMGEIVLIYQQGRSAVKQPNPQAPKFPKFYPRYSTTRQALLEVPDDNTSEKSQLIYSVSEVAIKTLDDAFAGLVAKRVAGIAAKAVIADQVRQKNELLGMITWLSLNAIDQADLRHWATLPETLQFARLKVKPGPHKLKVKGLDGSGNPTGEEKEFNVTVAANKKVFINWRSLR